MNNEKKLLRRFHLGKMVYVAGDPKPREIIELRKYQDIAEAKLQYKEGWYRLTDLHLGSPLVEIETTSERVCFQDIGRGKAILKAMRVGHTLRCIRTHLSNFEVSMNPQCNRLTVKNPGDAGYPVSEDTVMTYIMDMNNNWYILADEESVS